MTRRGARAPGPIGDGSPPALRVGIFMNSIEMGGVEEHVRQLAGGVVARGAKVTIVVPEATEVDPMADAAVAAGADVVRLTVARQTAGWTSVARFRELRRLFRAGAFDVVHVHQIGYTGARWAVVAAWLARVPRVLCTIHIAPQARERLVVRLDRAVMSLLIDRYIAVSNASRGRLVDFLGLAEDRVSVVPNAVDLARFDRDTVSARAELRARYGLDERAFVIGAVARLRPQKGVTHLVQAMATVAARFPDARALIVGDGELRADLEAQASALGIADRFRFVGHQTDVVAHLAAMDLFVLPSLYEGMPLAVLEAMAAGLPVVATAVDGTPEAVIDGETGYLVPAGDTPALAAAIVRVLDDRSAAARMGERGGQRSTSFGVDVFVERVEALYRGSTASFGLARPGATVEVRR